jgi:hypothetical protein
MLSICFEMGCEAFANGSSGKRPAQSIGSPSFGALRLPAHAGYFVASPKQAGDSEHLSELYA